MISIEKTIKLMKINLGAKWRKFGGNNERNFGGKINLILWSAWSKIWGQKKENLGVIIVIFGGSWQLGAEE